MSRNDAIKEKSVIKTEITAVTNVTEYGDAVMMTHKYSIGQIIIAKIAVTRA